MHDKKRNKEDGINTEVNPKSKNGIRYVSFNLAGLSFCDLFVSSFESTQVAMASVAAVVVPESGS